MTAELRRRYADALGRYVAAPDEEGRTRAYGLGRAAMSDGLGVLEVSKIHTLVLTDRPEVAAVGVRASEFLSEVLAPFEMALRGFREAHAALKESARSLEQRVADRTAELATTEARLREQRNVLRAVIDAMSDGVAVIDTRDQVVLFNPRGAELLGTGPQTMGMAEWGQARGILLSDEDTPMPASRLPFARALAGEDVLGEELFLARADHAGGLHLSVSASPLRDEAGDVSGAVIVFRDVTPRRHAEEALRRARDRGAQAQRLEAIGQLAAGVAHDFNNLLAVIVSYASLVQSELPPGGQAAADLHEIAQAAQSAAALTRQLLAFSRQQVLRPRQLELDAVVQDVARMLGRTLGERVKLATAPASASAQVLVDRGQLEQVLMNLALNARDAMPDGGHLMIETHTVDLDEAVTAGSGAISPGPYVVLSVTDTGIGMDKATLGRVFEPFFTTKELGRGTGLGLATVYGIVRQSGGHIAVYSELGRGTAFKIYLPRAVSAEARPTELPARPPPPGSETILLVEDDEHVRLVIARVLRAGGYHVLVAREAFEARALAVAHGGPIHLLMTDLVMPGTSGAELAAELTRARPDMRVLFASGYSLAAMVHQGTLVANAAFLEKPFTPELLRRRVRDVLGGGGSP